MTGLAWTHWQLSVRILSQSTEDLDSLHENMTNCPYFMSHQYMCKLPQAWSEITCSADAYESLQVLECCARAVNECLRCMLLRGLGTSAVQNGRIAE